MRLSSWELWRKGGEAAWVPRSLQNQTFGFLLEQYSCSLSLRQDCYHDKEQRDGDYFEDNDAGDTDDNDVGSIRQFLGASDKFCAQATATRLRYSKLAGATWTGCSIFIFVAFYGFGVFWCIFVFGMKQKTCSGRLCWRISWTTSSTCFAMRLAAICVR